MDGVGLVNYTNNKMTENTLDIGQIQKQQVEENKEYQSKADMAMVENVTWLRCLMNIPV